MSKKDYIEHVDYYLEDGRIIFTEKYLKQKGNAVVEHVDIVHTQRKQKITLS
jgi:hypothetical protein